MIELMIAVVIIGVLAAVATIAYSKYVARSRLLAARAFISAIQAREEAYMQQFGYYTSPDPNNYYPALLAAEPVAKPWAPSVGTWDRLNVYPDGRVSYFEYLVTVSSTTSSPRHALDSGGVATLLGIQVGRPWYFVVARGNLDGRGTCLNPPPLDNGACTMMYGSSARNDIVILNEGK
jgi:type II secretory pathway pseudopilin PulG